MNQISEYALCHSRNPDRRCSPEVRITRSGSGCLRVQIAVDGVDGDGLDHRIHIVAAGSGAFAQQCLHGIDDFLATAISDCHVDIHAAVVDGPFDAPAQTFGDVVGQRIKGADDPDLPVSGRSGDLVDDVGHDLHQRVEFLWIRGSGSRSIGGRW